MFGTLAAVADGWKAGFVAVSVLIGESLDDVVASIDETEDASTLVQTLRTATRDARSRAIAAVLTNVAAALPQWEADA